MEADGADDSGGLVVLFYKYVPIARPEEHAEWQRGLCQRLGLTGKLRVAREGLNGTLGGAKADVEAYQRELDSHPLFAAADVQWKHSPGSAGSFDELSVRVVNEIITLDVPGLTADQAGTHLSPVEFHHALEQPQENVVLIDCRNDYESQIGRFNGAVAPPVRKFSLFPKWVDENLEALQGKKVYQLHGGIHKYIEQFPDGHFRGKNYVFDLRQSIAANDDVLSACLFCSAPHDAYVTCSSQDCYKLLLACESCRGARAGKVYCCQECQRMGPKWNKVLKTPKPRPGRAERRRRRMEKRRAAARSSTREEEDGQQPTAPAGAGDSDSDSQDEISLSDSALGLCGAKNEGP